MYRKVYFSWNCSNIATLEEERRSVAAHAQSEHVVTKLLRMKVRKLIFKKVKISKTFEFIYSFRGWKKI